MDKKNLLKNKKLNTDEKIELFFLSNPLDFTIERKKHKGQYFN